MEHRNAPFLPISPALAQGLATAAFVLAWGWLAVRGWPGGATLPIDLSLFSAPFGALPLLTLIVMVLAVARAILALRTAHLQPQLNHPAEAVKPAPNTSAPAFSLALLAAAVWPFVWPFAPGVAIGLVGLHLMLALSVLDHMHGTLLSGRRAEAMRLSRLSRTTARTRLLRIAPVAVFAGWSISVGGALLSVVFHDPLGGSPIAATALGLLAIAIVTVLAQLAANRTPELSVAVIWAMIGLAASQIDSGLPTLAVAGVSLLAAGIVRVAS